MIIFLYGADTYRSKQKLSALKQKFISSKDKKGISVVEFDAREANVALMRKTVLTKGLFSEKRLIIIKEILKSPTEEKEKELLKALSQEAYQVIKHADDNILIFWDYEIKYNNLSSSQKKLYNTLEKTEYAQEFKPLNHSQLILWIKKYVAKYKRSIEPLAINMLIDICGNNLWELQNELDKLIAYTQSAINKKDITTLVIPKTEQNIWNLVDAIGQKNKSSALRLLSDQIRDGTNIDYIIAMLAHQYRTIIRIKSFISSSDREHHLANSYEISRALLLHPFVCKKGLNQEKNYTLKELKKIYRALLEIDFIHKTRQINSEALLDILIVKRHDN